MLRLPGVGWMSFADIQSGAVPGEYASPLPAGGLVQMLFLPAGLYGAWCVLVYVLVENNMALRPGLALLHVGGAAALLVCWRLGRWRGASFACFGAVLLLVAAAFRLQAMADTIAYGPRLDDMYRYRTLVIPDPVVLLFIKGELITVVGIMMIAFGWRVGVGRGVWRHTVGHGSRRIPLRLAIVVYLAALAVDVGTRALNIGLGPFQQMASLLFGFGVASIYFIVLHVRSSVRRVAYALLMGAPVSYLALRSGMKSELFFPLLPAVAIYWVTFRRVGARVALVICGFALLSLSQMYVYYVRDTTWKPDGNVQVSADALVEGFAERFDPSNVQGALDSTSARVNLTTSHAISVALAEANGFEPMQVFGMIPASLVPRLLWPSKPILQPGAMQTERILGRPIAASEIKSATAPGFLAEFFIGGGWVAVGIGAMLYGYLVAWAQKWALGHQANFGHPALCFLVLYWSLRLDENQVVYAFTAIVFTVVFLWMLKAATGMLKCNKSGPE